MEADLSRNPASSFARNPGYSITTKAHDGAVVVSFEGTEIARSQNAVLLQEGSYPPVIYLPIEDVNPTLIRRSSHVTHCPYKGEASYWNVEIGEHEIDNALWGYETPYDEMLEIAGLVAFYPGKVTIST
ncbi:MAG: DUF427 domain-containing protein [Nitratireductor sp.]